jgi:hypothetical protein
MYLHHYKKQTFKEQMRLNKLRKITPKQQGCE